MVMSFLIISGNTISASDSRSSAAFVNYRALYPFEARNHDEMSFNTGDIIQVRFAICYLPCHKTAPFF